MAVDEAHSSFITQKISNLTKRTCLRCPEADVRLIDFDDERNLTEYLLLSLQHAAL